MKNMRWNKGVDGYSAALILSEGRVREREPEEVVVEPLPPKSLWLRISPNVVKRIATLAPVYDDQESAWKKIEGPLAEVMREKLAALKTRG